jgi:hypothetical protein
MDKHNETFKKEITDLRRQLQDERAVKLVREANNNQMNISRSGSRSASEAMERSGVMVQAKMIEELLREKEEGRKGGIKEDRIVTQNLED